MSLHSRTVRTARAASDPYLWGQNGATEQTFIMIKPDAVGTPWLSHEITTDEEGNEVANDVVRANDKADAIKDRIAILNRTLEMIEESKKRKVA